MSGSSLATECESTRCTASSFPTPSAAALVAKEMLSQRMPRWTSRSSWKSAPRTVPTYS